MPEVCLDVLALGSRRSLAIVKPAISDLCNVSVRAVFRCLRRAEYVSIAERIEGNGMDYSNGLISERCEEYFSTLSPAVAQEFFLEAMRARKTDAVSYRSSCNFRLVRARQRNVALHSMKEKTTLALTMN